MQVINRQPRAAIVVKFQMPDMQRIGKTSAQPRQMHAAPRKAGQAAFDLALADAGIARDQHHAQRHGHQPHGNSQPEGDGTQDRAVAATRRGRCCCLLRHQKVSPRPT